MREIIRDTSLKCDLCGCGKEEVYDTPAINGRWAYVCRACVAAYSITPSAIGSYIRTAKGLPYWKPEGFNEKMRHIDKYLNSEGLQYLTSMDLAWCMYDDEGIRMQITYVLSNLDKRATDIVQFLEAWQASL